MTTCEFTNEDEICNGYAYEITDGAYSFAIGFAKALEMLEELTEERLFELLVKTENSDPILMFIAAAETFFPDTLYKLDENNHPIPLEDDEDESLAISVSVR